jgi:hypothetical protein
MATVAANSTVGQDAGIVRPYAPSWIDRLMDWVQQLPGPAWLYYLGVALVLVLVRTVAAWSDGSYPVGTFFPVHILNAISGVYWLLMLHYLDDRAGAALADFRPVLNVGPEGTTDAGYERLRYQLTTMPARPVLLWSIIGFVWGLVANSPLLWSEAQLQALKLFTSPTAALLDCTLNGLSFMIGFVFFYHTIRQLRLVSRIYTQHTKINLFETGPLYTLSRITGLTTIALLFLSYLYAAFAFNWQIDLNSPGAAVIGGSTIFIALATFVWPLFGAHTLLQQQKVHRKSAVAQRMEAVTDELHHRVDTHELQNIDALKNALDGLVLERGVLDKVSTWPWEPETVRAVVTTLLLPVVLWIVTRVLERLGF